MVGALSKEDKEVFDRAVKAMQDDGLSDEEITKNVREMLSKLEPAQPQEAASPTAQTVSAILPRGYSQAEDTSLPRRVANVGADIASLPGRITSSVVKGGIEGIRKGDVGAGMSRFMDSMRDTEGTNFIDQTVRDPTLLLGGVGGKAVGMVGKAVAKRLPSLVPMAGRSANIGKAAVVGGAEGAVTGLGHQAEEYGQEGTFSAKEAGKEALIGSAFNGILRSGVEGVKILAEKASKLGITLPAWVAGIRDKDAFEEVVKDPTKLKELKEVVAQGDEGLLRAISGERGRAEKVIDKKNAEEVKLALNKDKALQSIADDKTMVGVEAATSVEKVKDFYDRMRSQNANKISAMEGKADEKISKLEGMAALPSQRNAAEIGTDLRRSYAGATEEVSKGYEGLASLGILGREGSAVDAVFDAGLRSTDKARPKPLEGASLKEEMESYLLDLGAEKVTSGAGNVTTGALAHTGKMGMPESEFKIVTKLVNKLEDIKDVSQYWHGLRKTLKTEGIKDEQGNRLFDAHSEGAKFINNMRLSIDNKIINEIPDEKVRNAILDSKKAFAKLGQVKETVSAGTTAEDAYGATLKLAAEDIRKLRGVVHGDIMVNFVKEAITSDLFGKAKGDMRKLAAIVRDSKRGGLLEEVYGREALNKIQNKALQLDRVIASVRRRTEDRKVSLKELDQLLPSKKAKELDEISAGTKEKLSTLNMQKQDVIRGHEEASRRLIDDPHYVIAKAFLGKSGEGIANTEVGILKSGTGEIMEKMDELSKSMGYDGPSLSSVVKKMNKGTDIGLQKGTGKFGFMGGGSGRQQVTGRIASGAALAGMGAAGAIMGDDEKEKAGGGAGIATGALLLAMIHPGMAYAVARAAQAPEKVVSATGRRISHLPSSVRQIPSLGVRRYFREDEE